MQIEINSICNYNIFVFFVKKNIFKIKKAKIQKFLKKVTMNYMLWCVFFYFTQSYLVNSVMVNDTELVLVQLVNIIRKIY
jgi:hypothetical protein